jgi:hypothetical protein
MADKKVYRQWRAMTVNARQLAADNALPLWQKAYRVPGAYNNIELSGLRSRHRSKMLTVLGQINLILQQYELETFDDYQTMSEQDLQKILTLAQGMSHTDI